MIDDDLDRIVAKQHKLKELSRARERVRQLEQELCGAPPRPEQPPHVPEFLRQRTPRRIS